MLLPRHPLTALCAIACAIFGIAAAYAMGGTLYKWSRLSTAGVTTQAFVRGYEIERRMRYCQAKYQFVRPDGNMQNGRGMVPAAISDGVGVGGTISVIYDPADPATSTPDLGLMLVDLPWQGGLTLLLAALALGCWRTWRGQAPALIAEAF